MDHLIGVRRNLSMLFDMDSEKLISTCELVLLVQTKQYAHDPDVESGIGYHFTLEPLKFHVCRERLEKLAEAFYSIAEEMDLMEHGVKVGTIKPLEDPTLVAADEASDDTSGDVPPEEEPLTVVGDPGGPSAPTEAPVSELVAL